MARVSQIELDRIADVATYSCDKGMHTRLQELRAFKWKVFSVNQAEVRGQHLVVVGLSQPNIDGTLTSRWLQYDGKLYAPPKGKKRYEWNWDSMAARKIADLNQKTVDAA